MSPNETAISPTRRRSLSACGRSDRTAISVCLRSARQDGDLCLLTVGPTRRRSVSAYGRSDKVTATVPEHQRLIGPTAVLLGTFSSLGDMEKRAIRCRPVSISATKYATISRRKGHLDLMSDRFPEKITCRVTFLCKVLENVYVQQFNKESFI